MARVVVLGLVVAATGCDQLWSLPHIEPTDAGDRDGMAGGDDTTDASGHAACPAGYDIDSNVSPSRYRYVATLTSWDMGQGTCMLDDVGRTHLVVLTDDAERTDVLALLGQRGLVTSFWIGLSDRRAEGNYLWVTDEPVGMPPLTTPPWGAGEPNNEDNAQDCVRIGGDASPTPGLFTDEQCNLAFYILCECDGVPPEPMNY